MTLLKTILSFFLFLFAAYSTGAQDIDNNKSSGKLAGKGRYHNTISISGGGFYIRNTEIVSRCRPCQRGISYQRKINDKWSLGLGATGLPLLLEKHQNYWVVDQFTYRQTYNMVDLFGVYTWYLGKHHQLHAGMGLSYNWGTNTYIEWFSKANFPPDYQVFYYDRKVHYWGALTNVSYDYLFWKNRLRVGAYHRARFYMGRDRLENDFGLQAGYNF